jgi:hypothetical protein
MDTADAATLLVECEKGLRQLVSSAAAEGDYASVIKLTAWARVIKGLTEDAITERSSAITDAVQVEYQGDRVPNRLVQQGSSSSKGSSKARPAKRSAYPRFFRTGRELIKIGWSKRQRAEYLHKASYSVLMQLISKLAVVGAGGAIFAAENVIPLESEEGSPIPNYQAYLCLAWLRREGLVEAHGRQGYTFSEANLASAVTSKWNGLDQWRR